MLASRGAARGAIIALAVLLTVAACTSDDTEPAASGTEVITDEPSEPSPPAGLRVGVVLPDEESVDASVLAAMTGEVRRLDSLRDPAIAEIRPYQPREPAFIGDLAWSLAERRTDLICLVGRASRSLVAELAELHPHLAFCASPLGSNVEVPPTVQVLELRAEELGHVVGLAAAAAAEGGVVGLVLGTEELPRGVFRDGVLAGLGATEVVQTTVDDELDATAAVQQVLAEGAEVVVIDSVVGASVALEVAAESALVLSPDVVVRGAAAEQSVLTWRVRWDVVLRRAIDDLLDDTPRAAGSFGFREEVFTVSDGAASTGAGWSLVQRAIEGLTERTLDPLEPSGLPDLDGARSLPVPSEPDEEGGEDPDPNEDDEGDGDEDDGDEHDQGDGDEDDG